jgi:hypothetical protein
MPRDGAIVFGDLIGKRTVFPMSRYKGRASPKEIEKDFPRRVSCHRCMAFSFETKATERHSHLYDVRIRAIHSTGRRDESNRDYIRWCFADETIASEFAREFGSGNTTLIW